MESSSKGMSEDEKMEAAVDILMNETQLFNELFFRYTIYFSQSREIE